MPQGTMRPSATVTMRKSCWAERSRGSCPRTWPTSTSRTGAASSRAASEEVRRRPWGIEWRTLPGTPTSARTHRATDARVPPVGRDGGRRRTRRAAIPDVVLRAPPDLGARPDHAGHGADAGGGRLRARGAGAGHGRHRPRAAVHGDAGARVGDGLRIRPARRRSPWVSCWWRAVRVARHPTS